MIKEFLQFKCNQCEKNFYLDNVICQKCYGELACPICSVNKIKNMYEDNLKLHNEIYDINKHFKKINEKQKDIKNKINVLKENKK